MRSNLILSSLCSHFPHALTLSSNSHSRLNSSILTLHNARARCTATSGPHYRRPYRPPSTDTYQQARGLPGGWSLANLHLFAVCGVPFTQTHGGSSFNYKVISGSYGRRAKRHHNTGRACGSCLRPQCHGSPLSQHVPSASTATAAALTTPNYRQNHPFPNIVHPIYHHDL